MEPTPTTRTLATAVSLVCHDPDPEAVKRAAQRLQNWVKAGLIRPVRQKTRGRGVHRRFDRHEILKIVTLTELIEYGLPWDVLRRASDLFDDVRPMPHDDRQAGRRTSRPAKSRIHKKLDALFRQAVAGERAVYLLIQRTGSADIEVRFGDSAQMPANANSVVIVNLTNLFQPYVSAQSTEMTARSDK